MNFMQATGLPIWAVFDEKRSVLKLAIYCQPGAKQTQIQGLHDGRLKIRLMAAPVDGAANDALLDFLVKRCGLARQTITIKSGQQSRQKILEINSCNVAKLPSLIAVLMP